MGRAIRVLMQRWGQRVTVALVVYVWGLASDAHAGQGPPAAPSFPPAVASALAATQPLAMMSRDAAGSVTLRAVRLTEPLRIDGRLDEALYKEFQPIQRTWQDEPMWPACYLGPTR